MSLMSIMSYEVMPVIEGTTMGVNYGFDKLRFISPVRAGSRVRGRFTLAEATVAQAEGAAVAHQRHRRDRGRGKASAGGRLDRPDLFCLKLAVVPGLSRHPRLMQRPKDAAISRTRRSGHDEEKEFLLP